MHIEKLKIAELTLKHAKHNSYLQLVWRIKHTLEIHLKMIIRDHNMTDTNS